MRILHVSEVHWGGVVGLVREFIDQQVANGDQAMLLAPSGFPELTSAPMRPWTFERRRPSTYPRAYAQLRAAIAEFRPDVVHLHSFMAGFVGRMPGSTRSTATVYQPHAWSFDLKDEPLFSASVKLWERIAGRRTDTLVTNCEAEIADGRAIGIKSPAQSLGIAIDPLHFCTVDEAGRLRYREECGVRERRMLVLVGRLTWQKGQDLLVESWEQEHPAETELVLVGPGDTSELEQLAPTQWGRTIRAVGEKSDVRPWIWASDALVLSSRYEGTAMVIGEAMACGRPVLATLVNGTEFIAGPTREPAGTVVPALDSAALLRAAAAVLDDPDQIASMTEVGRHRAETEFRPGAVAGRLKAAYEQAIRLKGRSPSPGGR